MPMMCVNANTILRSDNVSIRCQTENCILAVDDLAEDIGRPFHSLCSGCSRSHQYRPPTAKYERQTYTAIRPIAQFQLAPMLVATDAEFNAVREAWFVRRFARNAPWHQPVAENLPAARNFILRTSAALHVAVVNRSTETASASSPDASRRVNGFAVFFTLIGRRIEETPLPDCRSSN